MEPQPGQSLNDIQSYLVNFNKEISAGGQTFILASSEGLTQNHGSFVVAHGGEHLYGDATMLDGVASASMTVPKTEQVTEMMHDPKIEGVAITAQAHLDQTLLASEVDASLSKVFNPINIAPSQQQTTVDQLFSVQATSSNVATLATAVDVNQPQLITVQPNLNQQAPQTQLVALPSQQQQLLTMSSPLVIKQQEEEGVGPEGEEEEQGEEEEEEEEDEGVPENSENNYQTVTIVPSEVNQGGEVSYVLIVSQNDQDQKTDADGNIDMSVYDFKEENRGGIDEDDENGDGRRGIKGTPKKPQHQMASQLMCNYCNYTSPKRYLLTRHMKTHSEERPHKCHICDRGFKTVASLQNHINTHTGVRPHKCKECDAAFTTSGELVRHVRYRHTFEKPHKCPECDYASVELSKLKRHMRSHTGERPYQCPHCSYASPDTYKLKRHLRIHTGEKPYECDICHTRFTQSNSLKAHKLIHTGNKPIYQCELCPTTCGRKTDLKIHVQKLHTSDKPLQCKKCGKSFPDRYTWKIHVKTHEGEKCFKCELCPYAALSQRHLESHLLTHTGEKPFECNECEQSFRQKQLLRRHRNLYHTPDYVPPPPKEKVHECPECGKAFAHKGNLLRHRTGHDPDNQEYQEALANYKIQQGDDYEEEEEEETDIEDEEEDGELDQSDQQILVTQAVVGDGHGYTADPSGQVHVANINGQQVQLQLVNLNDEHNTQVYIQIDNSHQLQNLMGEQTHIQIETEEAEEEEEDAVTMEVDTPPTGKVLGQMRPSKLEVKQEDMKQEEMDIALPRRSRAVGEQVESDPQQAGDQSPQPGEKHKLELLGTPTKRIRRDSSRRRRDDDEDDTKREEHKKNIETCFGFDEL